MTNADLIIIILCSVNIIANIVNITLCITLGRSRASSAPTPSEIDHFALLEKRLYDLTNRRFGGTIK